MQKIVATTDANSTNEGWMATWNTGYVDRAHAVSVFNAEGFGKCIPAADPLLSLKDAVRLTLDNLGMKRRGEPIDVKNLDRSAIGCCAVREVRGVRKNEYPFLFSCALHNNGNSQQVQFLEVSGADAPEVAANQAQSELMLNAAFWHFQGLMQPTHLTTALSKMLRQFKTVRIKEGVHFLPGNYTDQFDRVISGLESHPSCQAQFTTLVWSLAAGTRSLKAVITAVKQEIDLWKGAMDKELSEMQTAGTKMRSDGLETRMRQCVEQREFLKLYEELVGTLPSELYDTINATEAAIANYGLLAMSS